MFGQEIFINLNSSKEKKFHRLQVDRGIRAELSDEAGRERMVVVLDARGASSLALTRHMSLLKHIAVTLNQHYPVRVLSLRLSSLYVCGCGWVGGGTGGRGRVLVWWGVAQGAFGAHFPLKQLVIRSIATTPSPAL